MSSYVVEDRTVNRILTFLQHPGNGLEFLERFAAMKLETDVHNAEEMNTLGLRMLAMNHEAVSARYGEEQEIGRYKFRAVPMPTLMQAYKTLQCWLYQCSEGTIPECSELYQAFEEIKHDLAAAIVSQLAAYDVAEWA